MGEFLLLMVALDKIYYSPLGKFMDDRDAEIREKLNSVKDTSEEVKQLEDQAAAIMKAARAEISAALNKMKKETQQELEQKLLAERKKVEAELQEALGNLEKQKDETVKALDSQIAVLSEEIVKKARLLIISYNPVKAFFPPAEDPAGMTFKTLNLTVLDKGLWGANSQSTKTQLHQKNLLKYIWKDILEFFTCTGQW